MKIDRISVLKTKLREKVNHLPTDFIVVLYDCILYLSIGSDILTPERKSHCSFNLHDHWANLEQFKFADQTSGGNHPVCPMGSY